MKAVGPPKTPGHHTPERDDTGAGERGDVHQMRRAELARLPEPVAQNEPTLGVGVDDFDGRARRAANHVARLQRAASRHVLGRRHHADHSNRRLEQRRRPQRANHGRAAGHVHLHPLHAVGRLDRDAAGVKRDALAHQAKHRTGRRPRRVVLDHDHARRLGAALRDAQQQAHATRTDLGLVEHRHRQRRALSRGFGTPRQLARRQHVGRLVAERAREVRAFRQHAAPADRGVKCGSLGLAGVAHDQAHAAHVRQLGGRALEMARLVLREDNAFGSRLHEAGRRRAFSSWARRARCR